GMGWVPASQASGTATSQRRVCGPTRCMAPSMAARRAGARRAIRSWWARISAAESSNGAMATMPELTAAGAAGYSDAELEVDPLQVVVDGSGRQPRGADLAAAHPGHGEERDLPLPATDRIGRGPAHDRRRTSPLTPFEQRRGLAVAGHRLPGTASGPVQLGRGDDGLG